MEASHATFHTTVGAPNLSLKPTVELIEYVVGQITTPKIYTRPPGIIIDVAQFQPTDRPIEDRFSVDFDISQNRLIVGLYDGHGGSETAHYISNELPLRLLHHSRSSAEHIRQFKELDESIIHDFRHDHSIMRRKSNEWVHHAQLIKSGSTALILDIDFESMEAAYANAGDCRMVVCDPNSTAILLQTEDMNMSTSSERERLAREHPHEEQMIVGGRLFGRLMCTRGFGDGYFKLPIGVFGQHRRYIDTLSAIEKRGKIPMNCQYAPLFHAYKTPPYITPVPVTGTCQLRKGHLIVLATDGFWDLISSQNAMDIAFEGLRTDGVEDLARYLLDRVKTMYAPDDDITLIVMRL
ncbi:protein serine/threonine phosphatase 2C [Pholiota conissans]|uniref:Protein serine/threonine phosphatase 2C n=1 Tax=Pholiota conissans TaxID=109636 RepID=A0A9P5ZE22_9AGAR|nr:protein serine/threonine phosphatase 2C [Pholiota conissans]